MDNKEDCLDAAIEIVKAYARGGAGNGGHDNPAEVLESVYRRLLKLSNIEE